MIEIRHDRESGTLIFGTEKGDGSAAVISAAGGFRPSRRLPEGAYWYIPKSRDKPARRDIIANCEAALSEAGFEVSVTIDDTTPATTSVADREQEAYERAGERADRFGEYAENATGRGAEILADVRAARKRIGDQPLLVDHHSYSRDLNDRRRLDRREERGRKELGRGAHWARRSAAAAAYQGNREAIRGALLRIERLEADERGLERELEGLPPGEEREWKEATLARLHEALDHWREHVADAEGAGVKVWRAADFKAGDFALVGSIWFEVVAVSAKSLRVPVGGIPTGQPRTVAAINAAAPGGLRHDRVPYTSVFDRIPASETRSRFPDAFPELPSGVPPRPSKNRGKVSLESAPGPAYEGWRFPVGEDRYYVRWRQPEGWFATHKAPVAFYEPGELAVVRIAGLGREEPVATVPVSGPIYYLEEVHNQVRAWVEQFAREQNNGSPGNGG